MTIYTYVLHQGTWYHPYSLDSLGVGGRYSPPLLRWPSGGYFGLFAVDSYLLKQALLPNTRAADQSIADQVFGNQRQQEYVNVAHATNLLYERARLHRQHLRDMDHRHMQIQEMLFGVRINNFPDKAKRQGKLESQLLQLEQQKRDEELAFWKDTVDLRQQLIEGASLYKAAKHRYSVFADVEAGHGA
jgi:hypothetical protein